MAKYRESGDVGGKSDDGFTANLVHSGFTERILISLLLG